MQPSLFCYFEQPVGRRRKTTNVFHGRWGSGLAKNCQKMHTDTDLLMQVSSKTSSARFCKNPMKGSLLCKSPRCIVSENRTSNRKQALRWCAPWFPSSFSWGRFASVCGTHWAHHDACSLPSCEFFNIDANKSFSRGLEKMLLVFWILSKWGGEGPAQIVCHLFISAFLVNKMSLFWGKGGER